ncbi:MlaD family protein [Actinocorallia libanotica]|uniref:Phospholipid/cholesterol/gamma-HCH transport system substrate-binding protein n=1 Tax=Actinocorallia libanotica TaxID=46162 RepID=A0ABP4CDF1_9ACTN
MARGTIGRYGPTPAALVKVSIFVVVSSLLTFSIGSLILGSSFNERYELRASFDDVGGLLANDLVKVSGAPVGKVTGVKVVRGRAEVTMMVDRGVKLPADSTAEIRWRNLMGQRMIYLMPGDTRSGRWLEHRSRIRATKAVVDLGEIVDTLGPLTRNLDPEQLNKILQAVAEMLEGNTEDINAMTVGLQQVVRTFADRKEQLTSILDSYSGLTDVAVRRDRQIDQVIGDLVAISEAFAGNTELLGSAGGELAQVSRTLDRVISGNQRELERAITNLDRIAQGTADNADRLEQVLQGLPPALRSLFSVANGGHYLRVNAMCINVVQGSCPTPMRLPGPENKTTDQERRDGAASLRSLLGRLSGQGGR